MYTVIWLKHLDVFSRTDPGFALANPPHSPARQWRESVLHTQTVEGVFRKHMQALPGREMLEMGIG